MALVTFILMTLVSEDLTCITAGLLVSRGEVGVVTALGGCYIGIVVGDLLLWTIGRFFGRTVLTWPRVQRRLPTHTINRLEAWFNRNGHRAVIAARFLPGSRFPIYVAAGALGRPARRFAVWAAAAALIWTPLLVGAVALLGEPIVKPLERVINNAWLPVGITVIVMFAALRVVTLASTEIGRARLVAFVSRIWRWEFWPTWLFYLPLLPWIVWLAWRHRGLTTVTAANPGIPHGGIVGESKYDILQRLPAEWIVPTRRIGAASTAGRTAQLRAILAEGWTFPLILKPDVGERGAGLCLAHHFERAEHYLSLGTWPVLVQHFHPGPYEAGIFYVRLPGDAAGRIFSITDKHFAAVHGDGESTVETLIWRHPRYRMQARRFLARMNGQAEMVPKVGVRVPLVVAGNHCQGTMFCDGARLRTRELEARIDAIARSFDGFFFGRFDVRYQDPAELEAGRGFAIVELNGAASESTNIYDPNWSLLRAYRTLARQWRLLFEVGAGNRRDGHAVSSLRELRRLVRSHYASGRPGALAD